MLMHAGISDYTVLNAAAQVRAQLDPAFRAGEITRDFYKSTAKEVYNNSLLTSG